MLTTLCSIETLNQEQSGVLKNTFEVVLFFVCYNMALVCQLNPL